MKVVEASESVT